MSNHSTSTAQAPDAGAPIQADAHIHMPSPSFSPIILALGLAILVFGLVFGAVALVLGGIITVIGLGTWILDDIRSASAENADH
jgi:membrane-bound ClpP family serine protease